MCAPWAKTKMKRTRNLLFAFLAHQTCTKILFRLRSPLPPTSLLLQCMSTAYPYSISYSKQTWNFHFPRVLRPIYTAYLAFCLLESLPTSSNLSLSSNKRYHLHCHLHSKLTQVASDTPKIRVFSNWKKKYFEVNKLWQMLFLMNLNKKITKKGWPARYVVE